MVREQIAEQAAAGLEAFASQARGCRALVGFDGFVDAIIHVVDQRQDEDHYRTIPTIDAFGQRILAAAGRSSNMELVTQLEKLGGNGPIMAHALQRGGLDVSYVGSVGYPQVHPVFADFAQAARVYPVLEPGTTDALEFRDGKLLLGKYEHVSRLNYELVCERMGREAFAGLVGESRLLGMVNWTMLPGIESIWRALVEEILPEVGETVDGQRRMLFVDLADPQKRAESELGRALEMLGLMNEKLDVVLGMNLKESGQVGRVLGLTEPDDAEDQIEATAVAIRQAAGLHGVVVHPRTCAAAALEQAGGVVSARFAGPFVREPKLSTGAGDNFNAGFCLGLMAGLGVEPALCAGTATSGYYVRHGDSPTLEALSGFCRALPEPEPAC